MIRIRNIEAIVTDIEGTTSSLSFVKDVLFPYARARIPDYVRANRAALAEILDEVKKVENNPALTDAEIIAVLLRWMDEDRKITPLKKLQGMIWREGYERGELRGHIYEDAQRVLKYWSKMGIPLYVYSSGSVEAQKLLFAHTPQGDLTPMFSGYFDTETGPKLQPESYKKIAEEIETAPENILFLSDHAGEVEAARNAGFETVFVNRQNAEKNPEFQTIHNFSEILIQEEAA